MDAGRFLIEAHLREGRTIAELAAAHGVHRSWLYKLLKRPRSSLHRFEAALPNELWQIDATHWQLAGGAEVEILNVIDDHSRVLVRSDCFRTVKAADVVASFQAAAAGWGYPAALLSDNGAVFSGASRGARCSWSRSTCTTRSGRTAPSVA